MTPTWISQAWASAVLKHGGLLTIADLTQELIARLPVEAISEALDHSTKAEALEGVMAALSRDSNTVRLAEVWYSACRVLDAAGVPHHEPATVELVAGRAPLPGFRPLDLAGRCQLLVQELARRQRLLDEGERERQVLVDQRDQARATIRELTDSLGEVSDQRDSLIDERDMARQGLAKASDLNGKLAAAGAAAEASRDALASDRDALTEERDHAQARIAELEDELASAGVPDHADRAGQIVTLSPPERVRWLADRMGDAARARDQALRELSIERLALRQVGEARDMYQHERDAVQRFLREAHDELTRAGVSQSPSEAQHLMDSALVRRVRFLATDRDAARSEHAELEATRRMAAGAAEDLDRARREHQAALDDAAATELRLRTELEDIDAAICDAAIERTGDRASDVRSLARVRNAVVSESEDQEREFRGVVGALDRAQAPTTATSGDGLTISQRIERLADMATSRREALDLANERIREVAAEFEVIDAALDAAGIERSFDRFQEHPATRLQRIAHVIAMSTARAAALDEVKEQANALTDITQQLHAAQERIGALEGEVELLGERSDAATSEAEHNERELVELRRRFDDLERDRDRLARDLNVLQGDHDTVERKLREAERELSRSRSW
jgi:hypothetical protein